MVYSNYKIPSQLYPLLKKKIQKELTNILRFEAKVESVEDSLQASTVVKIKSDCLIAILSVFYIHIN